MSIRLGTLVALDIGSTMVKAALINKKDGKWDMVATAQSPTTVSDPSFDVAIGCREAMNLLAEKTGRQLLRDGAPMFTQDADVGCDALIACSSAGGGLQMMVIGIMKELTAESAQRAVLGGGALVQNVEAVDDGRTMAEKIQILREERPDAILVAGGTDGGNVSHVIAIAELIRAAGPTLRFGDLRTPIIFAANVDARAQFMDTLGDSFDVRFVDNIRPSLEEEVLGPARLEIGKVFLQHVVNQAPGYPTIHGWTGGFIRPTPAATGTVLERYANKYHINVLALDVGGATTDVYSVLDGIFVRTVTAGTGVGYGIGWGVSGAGIDFDAMYSWAPEGVTPSRFKNWIANKMVNPSAIPQTVEELILEHSLTRFALSTSLAEHHKLARELKGIQTKRSIADIFSQLGSGQSRLNMQRIDALIGAGGPLRHAPRPAQALEMLIDAVQPGGITEVYVDSSGALTVAGLLEDFEEGRGVELLESKLLPLGTTICPAFETSSGVVAKIHVVMPDGQTKELDVRAGDIEIIPLAAGQVADVTIRPSRGVDAGNGPGRMVKANVEGGTFGILIDTRGRPIEEKTRRAAMAVLSKALDAYPGHDREGSGTP